MFMLARTSLGRQIYAIGNRERAVFLSGVDTKKVLLICFAIAGACSAAGGVLLSGWANRSYQAMGDPYLLPAIAAVVLGGTNVMGGRGTYLGTIAGVILITILQSILTVLQPQYMLAEIGREDAARDDPPDRLRHRHRRHAAALRARETVTLTAATNSPRTGCAPLGRWLRRRSRFGRSASVESHAPLQRIGEMRLQRGLCLAAFRCRHASMIARCSRNERSASGTVSFRSSLRIRR